MALASESKAQEKKLHLTVENGSLETVYFTYVDAVGGLAFSHKGFEAVPPGQAKSIQVYDKSKEIAVRVGHLGKPPFKFPGLKSTNGWIDTKSKQFSVTVWKDDQGMASVSRAGQYVGKFHASNLPQLGFKAAGDFHIFPFDNFGIAKVKVR